MAQPAPIHVLGIAGSLRKGSFNRALLRAAVELVPEGVTLEEFDIAPIPMFNADLLAAGYPAPVEEFRKRIAASDALLFVTPEYNYSIPGVLKNAIDWASRPPDPPLQDKPAAMMGATPGALGTVLCQHHLRQTFVFNNMHPLSKPQVYVSRATDKFDAAGRLTDEDTRKRVRELLEALKAWTIRLK
jgi:chromate reductase